MPTFSVIIVNYNGGTFIRGMLASLRRQTRQDFEVIFVDNASSDGSADNLDTEGLGDFQLLKQSENLGFAGGNNLAAKAARGHWLVLLNPDAVAAPDWLERIADGIEHHRDARVFACAQYDLDHADRLDGAGDAYLVFGVPWRGGFGWSVEQLPATGTCFSPCGASAVYERELFLAHGGFDERFFCYCEDVDLGFRMQLAGEPCVFLSDAVIHHAGSGTSGRHSYFTLFHGNRNRTWTYIKNMPLPMLLLTLPGHLAILGYLWIRNGKRDGHRGLKDGMIAGLRGGWKLRRSDKWRGPKSPRKPGLWLKSMAWWPGALSDRRPIVRKLPLKNRP